MKANSKKIDYFTKYQVNNLGVLFGGNGGGDDDDDDGGIGKDKESTVPTNGQ